MRSPEPVMSHINENSQSTQLDPIMSDLSVIEEHRTPTNNIFQVVDTELPAQALSSNVKELMLIPKEADGYTSDGVGDKEVVTIGIHFLKSTPNSDDELSVEGINKKRNNKAKVVGERRFMRSVKDKLDPPPKQ